MFTTLGKLLLCGLVVLGIGGTALATHSEPKVAKSLKTSLVKSYVPCTSPDTVTSLSPGWKVIGPLSPSTGRPSVVTSWPCALICSEPLRV